MSALGQRMLGAVLVVAFASFYVWHGGKAALFLSMLATLMLVSALSIHFSVRAILTFGGKCMRIGLWQVKERR